MTETGLTIAELMNHLKKFKLNAKLPGPFKETRNPRQTSFFSQGK